MADSTLNAVRIKMRRLTRSPSANQLSDTAIDEYVNTFIQYDFPEHLRLFTLRETLTFYTEPNVDTYGSNAVPNDPLNNFENRYISVHEPVFVAGYRSSFTQSRDQFYNMYPLTNSISSIGVTGDGVTTIFNGTISAIPFLQNNVTFTSVDSSGDGLALVDYPASNTTGALGLPGAPQVLPSPFGQVNYITGAFTLNFPVAPGNGEDIESQTVPYVAARPQHILYFDNTFFMRPIPDKVYSINIEVYRRPTELLASNQSPELEQWWQYIAYGASKKLLEDRFDHESVAMIMPEFEEQQRLVLRKTLSQQSNERVATIYTDQSEYGYNGGYWGWFT